MSKGKRFRSRTAVSFIILFSFILLAVSGVIMYLRPEGNIARWTSWSIWGLNKQNWEGLHTLFSIFFILSVAFHVVYNWKAISTYFKGVFTKSFGYRRELTAAVVITALFLTISLWQIDPFWKLIDLRAYFKKGDITDDFEPPDPEILNLSVSEISAHLNIPMADLLKHVREDGYSIQDSTQSIRILAEINNVSPERLYMDMFDARIKP